MGVNSRVNLRRWATYQELGHLQKESNPNYVVFGERRPGLAIYHVREWMDIKLDWPTLASGYFST
jgi:hypothetical protein